MTIPALSALLERERELEALEALLGSARSGEGAMAVVQGAPGLGKTRLLRAAQEAAGDFLVLKARASELERDIPFGVVRQLVETTVMEARVDDDAHADLLSGAASLAVPVMVEVAGTARAGAAEDSALHGLYWLTANLAATQPVLLVVDDLQWADLPSLRWIVYMSQRIEGLPVAFVAATRPEQPGPAGDLLDVILSTPAIEVIHPRALSKAAVTELASRALAMPADPAFGAASHTVTGGNPFLLRELLNELAETGVAPTATAATTVARLSSDAVSRSAMTRLRRLPDACRELAEAVLTLGDGIELERAAQLAQLDQDTAADAADALGAAFILAPERPLAFVHPLVRASVYAKLNATARAALHARAAMMLMSEGAPPERIAMHWLAADPAGQQIAVSALQDAAKRAACRGAPGSAADFLRRALREPPTPEALPHVTLQLGRNELSMYDAAGALAHFRQAFDALPTPAERAEAANLLGIASMFAGEASPEIIDVLFAAIGALDESDRELGLRLEATAYSVGHLRAAAFQRYGEHELRFIADGDPDTVGERLFAGVRAGDATRLGTASEARRLALAALSDGRLLEELGPSDPSYFIPVSSLFYCDATTEALQELQHVLSAARESGSKLAASFVANFRAWTWMRRGMLNEVEIELAESIERPGPPSVDNGLVAVCEARAYRGDSEGAAALWEAANLDALLTPVRRLCDFYLAARARVRISEGRVEEALADLMACRTVEETYDVRTPSNTTWRSDAALLLADLDRANEARVLVDEEMERAAAFGSPRQIGTALRAAARIAPRDAAIQLHRDAVESLDASSDMLGQALTRLELGSALRRSGQRKEARDHLAAAIELARTCGAPPIAAQAHDELIAAGARPRRDPTESRTQLTASETRVARLAAEGLTNREVAQALFLTEKTIEVHLTNTYRKLDISSRSQLPRALGAVEDAP